MRIEFKNNKLTRFEVERHENVCDFLHKDFTEHRENVKNVGLAVSDRILFEDWSIQKLAGVFILLEDVIEGLRELENCASKVRK